MPAFAGSRVDYTWFCRSDCLGFCTYEQVERNTERRTMVKERTFFSEKLLDMDYINLDELE